MRVQLDDLSQLLSCCLTGYRRRPRVQQNKESIQSDKETEPCVFKIHWISLDQSRLNYGSAVV